MHYDHHAIWIYLLSAMKYSESEDLKFTIDINIKQKKPMLLVGNYLKNEGHIDLVKKIQ